MTANSKCKIQNANRAWWRRICVLHFAFFILHNTAPAASAQDLVGQTIVEVVVEQEGQRITDPLIQGLLETRVGEPLSMRDVRETFEHLYNLRRFDDVRPIAEAAPGGVRVRYVLVPSHPIDRIEFRGVTGLSEDDLRRLITDRFGRTPAASKTNDAGLALQAEYRRRGYPAAQISPKIEETHNPDRATLVFNIDAGRRAHIADIRYTQIEESEAQTLIGLPDIRVGEPYDADAIDRALRRWEERLRSQGYYEARASFGATIPDDAYLTVNLARGPRVVVEFTGDPLPPKDRDRLVPIRAEASADEDLLEDAKIAIEQYLQAGGYRDAVATYSRNDDTPGELKITFDVKRGPHYVVDSLQIKGHVAFKILELQQIVRIGKGDPYVRAQLDARAAAIKAEYLTRGYTRADVGVMSAVLPNDSPGAMERRVEVVITIAEGPQTIVSGVAFSGNTVLTDAALRVLVPAVPGAPYVQRQVLDGRDRIELEYANRGYDTAAVRQTVTFTDNDTRAAIAYSITEGSQSIVDQIIIVGNDRTKPETILNELEFRRGGPLGGSALINSQTRLAALGLFRRLEVQQIEHPGEARKDVVIRVEEADPTTLGWGGGVEGAFRTRVSETGAPKDRFEFVPRGSFEIGRRNLWGKNRSVNLVTRVSLRSTDVILGEGGLGLERVNRGFNEYRVVASYREPRLFSRRSELLLTNIVEQAVRTTFNFSRRIARAEVGFQMPRGFGLTGRYSFEKTRLFDASIPEKDRPIIDKFFPGVRISKFAGTFVRDTRDEIDPTHGMSLSLDGDMAARAIGSEVGFLRTFAQAFTYRRIPAPKLTVLALGARVGAAHGFAREKNGQIVRDLPASERFWAGGDTTVRGFSLDRLANADTISETGFPIGGNGVIILNGELRLSVTRKLQAVTFVDAGNVFKNAGDLSFVDLRPTAGFGVRYLSDFGPIRFDWGFNLDPKEFVPGAPEKRNVFHISLGQAF